jgi:hypothetical protein
MLGVIVTLLRGNTQGSIYFAVMAVYYKLCYDNND